MEIVGRYSFNGGREYVETHYPSLLAELLGVISAVDSRHYKTKASEELTMPGRLLYSPTLLNAELKRKLVKRKWETRRVRCNYPTEFYEPGYSPPPLNKGAFREMDFVKDKLGVEVQLGKYAFMVYNVAAKMTIFRNLGIIDAGIEVVPVRGFAEDFSSGVSYYEQFLWDLETRGVSNIDIPVLVLGIEATPQTAPPTPAPEIPAESSVRRRRTRPGPKPGSSWPRQAQP